MLKSRLIIFASLFIAYSGIIGSWLIPTRLLYGYGFYLYANLGKLVLISFVVLALLFRHLRPRLTPLLPLLRYHLVSLLLSLPLSLVFYFLASSLLLTSSFATSLWLSIATHMALISVPLALLIGCFGIRFIANFIKTFAKEIFATIGFAIVYDVAIFQVWKLWPLFSSAVLQAVRALSQIFTSQVTLVYPRTLYVRGYGVEIGESCSGLDSLFMFITMSIIIAVVDWKSLNHTKLAIMAIPGLLGLYLVNILRVFTLVMIGAFVSPELASKLFHTYLGMVLFILYFFLFWRLAYRSKRQS